MQSGADKVSAENRENTSGQGKSAAVPEEIGGWNWGACLLSWVWAFGNKRYDIATYGLAVYICSFLLGPIGWLAQLVISIILGGKGNEWAWQSKKWRNIEHFRKTQRTWAMWGIPALILYLLLALWAGITGFGIYHI